MCTLDTQAKASPPLAADGVQDDDEPALLLLVLRWDSPAAHRLHKSARLCDRAAPAMPNTLRHRRRTSMVKLQGTVQCTATGGVITSARPSGRAFFVASRR